MSFQIFCSTRFALPGAFEPPSELQLLDRARAACPSRVHRHEEDASHADNLVVVLIRGSGAAVATRSRAVATLAAAALTAAFTAVAFALAAAALANRSPTLHALCTGAVAAITLTTTTRTDDLVATVPPVAIPSPAALPPRPLAAAAPPPAALARARQANRSTSNVNLKRADSQSQLGSASSSNLKLSRAGPPSDAPSTSSLQLNRVAEPPQSDALPSQGGAGSSSCGESSTVAGAGKSTSGGASAEERPEPVPPATEPAVAVTASSAPAVNGETTPQDAGPKLEFAQISRVSFGDGGGGGGAKRQPRSRNHKKPSPLQTAKSGKLGMWLQERGLGAAEGALKENGIERLDDLLDFTSREDLEVLELDGQLVDVDHLLQEISKSSTSPGAPQGASGGASADEPARSVSEDEMPDGITSTMAS